MSSMLMRLERTLQPYLRSTGLVLCDRATLDDLSWLEYRGNGAAPFYVLSIFHLSAARTVTAEIWRPDQLCLALRQGAAERAADQRHTWKYEEGADGSSLAREIFTTVLGWVAVRLRPTVVQESV
jgi:hypothetical protein